MICVCINQVKIPGQSRRKIISNNTSIFIAFDDKNGNFNLDVWCVITASLFRVSAKFWSYDMPTYFVKLKAHQPNFDTAIIEADDVVMRQIGGEIAKKSVGKKSKSDSDET